MRGARVRLRVETQLRFFIGGHSPALTRPGGHGSLNLTGEQDFKRLIGGRFLSFYLYRGRTVDWVKCGIDFQHDPIYNLDFMMKRFTKAIRKDLLTRV